MVDFGESDKMIKISEKMDKSDIYKEFSSSDISFFIQNLKKFLNKEWNMITKLFVRVWLIYFPTYFYHTYIYPLRWSD